MGLVVPISQILSRPVCSQGTRCGHSRDVAVPFVTPSGSLFQCLHLHLDVLQVETLFPRVKASLFLFSAHLQINNKANVVTSPKETAPPPALVLLDSVTLPAFFTVLCRFSHVLSLYRRIDMSILFRWVLLLFLLSKIRESSFFHFMKAVGCQAVCF